VLVCPWPRRVCALMCATLRFRRVYRCQRAVREHGIAVGRLAASGLWQLNNRGWESAITFMDRGGSCSGHCVAVLLVTGTRWCASRGRHF